MFRIKSKDEIKGLFFAFIVPLLYVLINLVLKIRYVSYPSLANDEPFSVYHAQYSISTILSELSQGNNPPLYEIFLHIWISFFGISELSVRFPSVIFSSLTIYFIYQICRKYFNLKVAFLAVTLFTLSNYQMYFAHEARVYALFVLLSTVSMYQFLKLLSSNYAKLDVVLYIVIGVLLLYSHFFSWFIFFVQFIGLVISFKKEEIMRFGKYLGIILIFYLPYVGIFIARFIDSSGGTWIKAVENLRPLHVYFGKLVNDTHIAYIVVLTLAWVIIQKYITHFFKRNLIRFGFIFLSIVILIISLSIRIPLFPSYLIPLENEFLSPLLMVSFLLFFFVLFVHFQMKSGQNYETKVILSWFFLPGFIMFVSSFIIPMFIERYLVFIVPGFLIFLSVSISKLDSKLFPSLAILLIILMLIPFKPVTNNDRDVKALVAKVKAQHENGNSAIFMCPDYFGPTFTYYFNKELFTHTEGQNPSGHLKTVLSDENVFLVKSDHEVDSISKLNNYEKFIYIDADADFAYSDNNIKNYLNDKLKGDSVSIDSTYFPGIFNVYTYSINE
ncbi:glycosyltransferase family 39 protein [Brumimicrobium aurantiacum]|uniref:Glycosyltransferase RgtA/B/C/D-like domain-containing protein n=1 Tax=Brumimicrobium aurantiacum TaxID=1737063 RepID=A0A3E1F0D3_9FLAO|nr:glycosyltransferase family 39 protein [Brumimicrobium aurantiacum]RFC55264.1 hypothetical protein DXU93_05435 [Brumimicrobium aurantiacum]